LSYVFGYLDSDLHSQDEGVGEDRGEGEEEAAEAASNVCNGNPSVCGREDFGVKRRPIHGGRINWTKALAWEISQRLILVKTMV